MAPVQNLYRLVWGGRLFDKESWSCSLHFNSTDGLITGAEEFQTAISAWVTRTGSKISDGARLDFIKFNAINPADAKYILALSNEHLQDAMATGANTTAPGQDTVVVSTRTVLARGRGHAGRFFPPTGSLVVSSVSGLIDTVAAADMSNSASALLNDLNAVVGAGSSAVVFSKIAQQVQPITSVRVGRVVDTMRSRRRSISEEYSSTALG